VLIEAITVVVRVDAIAMHIAGGIGEFACKAPNATYRCDGTLAAVGFMSPDDVGVFVSTLRDVGLRFVEDGKCQDIAVVDQVRGPTVPCDWLMLATDPRGTRHAWLASGPRGDMATYANWRPGTSLTFVADPGELRIQEDEATGPHMVGIDGDKHYLGRSYSDGNPHARMMLARPKLLREAKRVAYNALTARGWIGLTSTRVEDPVFHIALRYENQLGLVFAETFWTTTPVIELDARRRARLLHRAQEMRAVPIVARCELFAPIMICSSGAAPGRPDTLLVKEGDLEVQSARVEKLTFTNLLTNAALREDFNVRARIEISDWELLDFAVQVVREKLGEQGFQIDAWSSEPGTGPHVLARKDDQTYRIVVGAARYPEVEPIFDQDRIMACAEHVLVHGGIVAKASVGLANANDSFTGDDAGPLLRGEGVFAKFGNVDTIDARSTFADRAVRIFISSTFTDFGKERDALMRRVLPELQRRSSLHGVSMSLVDLRWGVTRAESSNRQELLSCLREIDAAYPFFVGLIGERYGSIPPQNALHALVGEAAWLREGSWKASITDLEIRHAMLRPGRRNSSALVYHRVRERGFFRQKRPNVASEFAVLIEQLRRRGYRLREIGSDFESEVTESLWALIKRHYPEEASGDVALYAIRQHRQYGLHRAADLPENFWPQGNGRVSGRAGWRVAIQCNSSWEASALAGSMALSARKAGTATVFDHYTALTPRDAPIANFTSRLTEFTERTTGKLGGVSGDRGGAAAVIAAHLMRLESWAQRSARRVLVVVAETDLFGADEAMVIDTVNACTNVDVILSRAKGASVAPGGTAFDQAEWSAAERTGFIKSYLGRFNKKIDDDDVERLARHPLSVDLSFPRLVCDHLVTWSTFGTLTGDLEQFISAKNFKDVGELLLARAQERVGQKAWQSFAWELFDKRELRTEQELMTRAGISPSAFSTSMAIVAPMVERWSGRLWAHRGPNWTTLEEVLTH
jgi:hypothetical protein